MNILINILLCSLLVIGVAIILGGRNEMPRPGYAPKKKRNDSE